MRAFRPDDLDLSAADRARCQADIREGSKSFHAASLLLPSRARLGARALYAFCRSSDDLVDEGAMDGSASRRLRARLERIYAGRPDDHAEDRAFAALVKRYGLPQAVPEALIEGFEWDEAGREYETIDDLLDYAARVASTVGVMMARIMGCNDRHALARAADLGLAMQLTNIARDVGEDARRGRLYLPRVWMRDAGIDPDAFIRNPQASEELTAVVGRLLTTADIFYHRAMTGLAGLPLNCRPAIRSAALIYRDIGRVLRDSGYDCVSMRAHTSTVRKLQLIVLAFMRPLPLVPASREAPERSVAFLVDACALDLNPAPRGLDEKLGRMIELMTLPEERRKQVRG